MLKDRPGFIVNRISAPNQALLSAILDEGKVKPQELDAMMKKMGAKMAPFETADFVGLDVFCHTLDYYAKTLSPAVQTGQVPDRQGRKKRTGHEDRKGHLRVEGRESGHRHIEDVGRPQPRCTCWQSRSTKR